MNKKFSTLMAVAMLATGVNGWAQDFAQSEIVVNNVDGNYAVQGGVADAPFTNFKVDNTSWDATFPKVSPYALSIANGAKPIIKLNKTDGTADGRYFQIAVGDAAAKGKELLTMVWVDPLRNGSGHYELQIENVENANVNGEIAVGKRNIKGIHLDRTLWEVRVKKADAGTVLYYELINKSTQMTLQIPTSGGTTFTDGGKTYQEVPVNVVAGQTNWRWADGEKATQQSVIEAGENVLKNMIRAQFDVDHTIYLVKKETNGVVTLGALIASSNDPIMGTTITKAATTTPVVAAKVDYTPIIFEAWEANPVVLTAGQINAELGNDKLLVEGNTPDQFDFFFKPDVQNSTNPMLGVSFKAEAADDGVYRLPGDAPDGFVRFLKEGSNKEYLRVDTAYHDNSLNGRYDLQLAVSQILYPRYAVVEDGRYVTAAGKLAKSPNSGELSNYEIYGATSLAPNTAKSFAQLKRMSNFRPIFYPSTQSLRLQAEMLFKADKKKLADGASWWKQMADDAPAAGLKIAQCATDPTLVTSTPGNAEGYYPAYTQAIATTDIGERVLSYKSAWVQTTTANSVGRTPENGYRRFGETDITGTPAVSVPLWNAVGNLFVATPNTTDGEVTFVPATDMLQYDPAAVLSTPPTTFTDQVITSPIFATAHNNLVRLTSLTQSHTALTADLHDKTDTKYNGLLTYITITKLKSYEDVANIKPAFYYISNANAVSTDLLKNGDYRYEDLAATNATFAYWNALAEKWSVGFTDKANDGINPDMHDKDRSNMGNLVYSEEKLEIPSAQFYIDGNGGYYSMTNRESGRQWQTSYWWAVKDQPGVYINMATYTDGAGIKHDYRDTIRIEEVPAAVLANKTAGYLNISQAVAKADTSVFNFKFTSLGEVELFLGQAAGKDSILKVMKENPGVYKLERVRVADRDIYSQAAKDTADLFYGITNNAANQLERAKYYIYKDDVSSNSGVEQSGIRYREYITLESGKYRMTKVKVEVDANGYTKDLRQTLPGSEAGVRRAFYVKQISTVNPNQYVLVDPLVVSQKGNGTSTVFSYGARAFANQLTAEVQPAGLVSSASANAFDNSVFTIEKIAQYNYRDIRAEGVDRDTVEFFKAGSSDYLLSENNKVAGANTGLLEMVSSKYGQNNALFLDTANVSETEFPRFLIGLRSVDSTEVSNRPGHDQIHLQTTADYLVNLVDSAAVNAAYRYRNINQNVENEYYRLGFLTGVHKGTNLTMAKDGKVFDLSGKGNAGMNYATFAFRFADDKRENFYIETVYKGTQKGWLKTINNVLVVTPNVQEAEVFQVNKATTAPTDNEGIETTEVSVIAGVGSVTINNAAGKTVAISNILGQTIANTVITSDNATIAVPAGIVVVSVEGEAAVKAIVK